ncbi:MAG: PorV/PorQ family protein, partial [Flavobacteriales bacterium]|nr:PorV/PorQ family protein [Flavobacteriales bacterium]
MLKNITLLSAVFLTFTTVTNAQLVSQGERAQQVQLNTITTAVPFLMIAPDSRSGGIGDAGVALTGDATALHWNPAKLAFTENEFEVALSYSPWLRTLVQDMNLAYLSGYKKLNKTQAAGAALR